MLKGLKDAKNLLIFQGFLKHTKLSNIRFLKNIAIFSSLDFVSLPGKLFINFFHLLIFICRLSKLKILELRENHLRSLPE